MGKTKRTDSMLIQITKLTPLGRIHCLYFRSWSSQTLGSRLGVGLAMRRPSLTIPVIYGSPRRSEYPSGFPFDFSAASNSARNFWSFAGSLRRLLVMQTSVVAVVSVPAIMTDRVSEKSRGNVFSSGGRFEDISVCIMSYGVPGAGSGLFIERRTQLVIVCAEASQRAHCALCGTFMGRVVINM